MGATQSSSNKVVAKFLGTKKELEQSDDFFEQKMCVAWLIGVKNYSEVRNAKVQPKPQCKDLDQVPQDLSDMTAFFETLKFDRIIKTEQPETREMD